MEQAQQVEALRAAYEAAVIDRMKESGFLEVEIRVECLARCGDTYQDSQISYGWWAYQLSALQSAQAAQHGVLPTTKVQQTAPKVIHLNIGPGAEDCDFKDLHEVTWCDHDATDGSIQYVRADLATHPTTQGLDADWQNVKDDGLPPCTESQLYIGVNANGFAGVFNAVADVDGNVYCMYETAEGATDVLSGLVFWKKFEAPTAAQAKQGGA